MNRALRRMRSRLEQAPEIFRFGVVAVIGLVVDITLAYGATVWLGVTLVWAAALGFAVAACVNYMLHELWTFRSGARRLSAERALKYAATLGATLLARLLAVTVLARMLGEAETLTVLILAIGVSFTVNYLISKLLVFCTAQTVEDKRDQ